MRGEWTFKKPTFGASKNRWICVGPDFEDSAFGIKGNVSKKGKIKRVFAENNDGTPKTYLYNCTGP